MREHLNHHAVKASRFEDAHGPAILLEQDGTTEAYSVILHPWQLLAVCQHFGLIAGTGEAQKAIRTLQRRLLALDDRIQGLLRYMAEYSDHDHADLTTEMERLRALADLSSEWVAEMQDVAEEGTEPATTSPEQQELEL